MGSSLEFDADKEVDLKGLEGSFPEIVRDLEHGLAELIGKEAVTIVG